MTRYSLNLQIDSQSLSMLYAAGRRVTIARSVNGAPPNATWLVFKPLMNNTVTWDDSYGLFASTTQIRNGATILQNSVVPPPAVDAATYVFEPSLIFSGPTLGGAPRGSYRIQNNAPPSGIPMLSFGPTQSAAVNGVGTAPQPVSVTPLLSQMSTVLTPTTTIYVWLQSMYGSGTVIGSIQEPSTRVVYGDSVTSQTLVYDASCGAFVPASPLQAENTAAPHVEVSEPLFY